MSMEDNGSAESKIAARPILQHCAICREDKLKLKLLDCQHDFCANCVKRWYQQNSTDDKTVSCPHCRQVTHLLDGSVDNLPTKFAGQIRCLECYVMKDLDDCWWCQFCSTAACSKCILIHHKSHTVEPYERFDVLRLCTSWLDDRCHKDDDEEQWLCLALNQLAEQLCKSTIEQASQQRKRRARDLEIMRSALNEYGMLKSNLTLGKGGFTDQPEIPIPKMRLIFQQVLELAGMGIRQIQLEDVKANYGETLLSEFKRSVNKLTVEDLKAIAENQVTRRLLGKGCPPMATPNWEASVIRCAEMLRPVDICVTPNGTIVVADAEAGLLVFNAQKCLINKVADLQVRSVCYHPIDTCIVAAVPNEQKAKFYDSALILKRELTIPHADPWLQIRCTDMGVLFCATYDGWTYSVHVHCCLDEKEWRTFAILPDSVQQFFGITLLPATGRHCQNLAKLLMVTDTGNMYEIIVERLASTVLKHMRPIKIEQLDLQSCTSITTTDRESVVIVDDGVFYEISNRYKFLKTIGSVGRKAMVTSLTVAGNVLYATICNRRCVALFDLK